MKQCVRCQEWKPETDFGSHGAGHRDRFCLACAAAARRARYANDPAYAERLRLAAQVYRKEHPEHVAAKKREWSRANARKVSDAVARSRSRHPERAAARATVTAALNAGELRRLPCVECGNPKAEAHHHRGYAEEHWLDVVWLCRKCHRAHHRVYPEQLDVTPMPEWRNRLRLSDDALLDRLRECAARLGRAPTSRDVTWATTCIAHFGSWNAALVRAGFPPGRRRNLRVTVL